MFACSVFVKPRDRGNIGGRVAGQGQVGGNPDFTSGVIDKGDGDGYFGGLRNPVEAAFPALSQTAGAFRGNDQQEVWMSGELCCHFSDKAVAYVAFDRNAAQFSKDSAERPAK